jgi:hypothetical protein
VLKLLKMIGFIALLLLAVVIAGLIPVNLSLLKEPMERLGAEQLDLDITLAGPLRLYLGPNTRIKADKIVIQKHLDSGEPIARIEALTVKPRLGDILRGKLHLRQASVTAATVNYCAELPAIPVTATDSPLTSIALDELRVSKLLIECAGQEDAFSALIDTAYGSAPVDKAIELQLKGRANQLPLELSARSDSLNQILTNPAELPIHITVTAPDASLEVNGILEYPLDVISLEAKIETLIESPQQLLNALGIEISAIMSVQASGRIRLNPQEISLGKVSAQFGSSRVVGHGSVRFSSERVFYDLGAHFDQLDVTPFLDPAAEEELSEPASGDLQPLLRWLGRFDGKADLSADSLQLGHRDFSAVTLQARLNDGALDIDEASLMYAGAAAKIKATVSARDTCPQLQIQGSLNDISLEILEEFSSVALPFAGSIGQFNFATSSCGATALAHRNSVEADMTASNSSISLQVGGAPLSIETISATSGWEKPGQASMAGTLLGESLTAEVQMGPLGQLDSEAPWPVSLIMAGAGANLSLVGRTRLNNGRADFEAELDISAKRIGSLHRWIDGNPKSDLPLDVAVTIFSTDSNLQIDIANASLGQSSVYGTLTTRLEGNQQVLVTQLQSDRLILEEITAALPELPQDNVSTTGSRGAAVNGDNGWLIDGFLLPAVDLDVRVTRLEGINMQFQDMDLQGRLRDNYIEDARMKMRIENIPVAGYLDVDLRGQTGILSGEFKASNVDIGLLLAKTDTAQGVRADASEIEFIYESRGTSYLEHARGAKWSADIKNLRWAFEDSEQSENFDLDLPRIGLSGSPGQPTEWHANGTLRGAPFQARAQTVSPYKILQGKSRRPLRIASSFDKEVLLLTGELDRRTDVPLSARLHLSGEHRASGDIDLENLTEPLGDFSVQAKLLVADDGLYFSDLNARVGESSASGYFHIIAGKDSRIFKADIRSPQLQVDDFTSLLERWRDREVEEDTTLLEAIDNSIEAESDSTYFDINFEITDLLAGEEKLGQAKFGVYSNESEFRISPFSIDFAEGYVDAHYIEAEDATGFSTKVEVEIDNLGYGGLLRLLNPEIASDIGGQIFFDTSLESNATQREQLAGGFTGDFELLVLPENITAGVLDLWTANLVFALLPAPKDLEQEKKLNCMVVKFDIEDSIMKSEQVFLDTTDVIVRAKGAIDFGERTLDLIAAPQAKREKFLSMSTPVAITGPWNDFTIDIAQGGLVAMVFKWYMGLIYVPYKWLTGERFPADGLDTCFRETQWENSL